MHVVRITLAILGAFAALVASACGGSVSVPAGAVALVNGTEISKDDLDSLLEQGKKRAEASKQEFPKAGTPEFQSVQTQYVALLVQREEFRQAAEDLGVEITKKDIDKAENEFIESNYDGKVADYEKALKAAGFTRESWREWGLEGSILERKLFDAVTKDAAVTGQEVLDYYTQNQSQYESPSTRDVRHVLVAEKGADGQIDFAKSKVKADEIYTELEAGADFAEVAKRESQDPSTKDSGGKLTISRGQTVPEFEKTAYELDRGELSHPVKTQYGYHVIEALSPRPSVKPFGQVKNSIRATILQQKRTEVAQKWADDLRKEYDGKVSYAAGYEPPEIPETTTETQ